MATIQELRDNLRKTEFVLVQIRKSVEEIQKQEALLFNQAMSGALDNISEAALKQKMLQFDAYREDRYSLLEQETQLKAERMAMLEEIVNSLRRKIGMEDIKNSIDRPDVPVDADDNIVPSPHPGHVPGPVVSNRKGRG